MRRFFFLCATFVMSVGTLGVPGSSVGATNVGVLALSESANLHSEMAMVGQTITVTLHNTYWAYLKPSSSALTQQGSVTYALFPGSCVPGAGCGRVVITYVAKRHGSVVLKASRTSCGEAMRCTGNNGRWSTTVVVH